MAETLEAGDKAPSSGIYKVVHASAHADPHYVTALCYGDHISCDAKRCVRERFQDSRLAISAVHVNAHPLFMRGQNR